MDVLAGKESLHERLVLADVCHDAQLNLRIVGREERVSVVGDECFADSRPSSFLIGMFCRFGFVDDRRPVAVTV